MNPASAIPGRDTDFAFGAGKEWNLVLYLGDNPITSTVVIDSVQEFCDTRLVGRYSLEVRSIREQTEQAVAQKIPAAPTLVRMNPGPIRRIIGHLDRQSYLAVSLGLASQADASY